MPPSSADMDQTFQTALNFHQCGQFADAERLYRHILDIQPKHADSLHLLGVLIAGRGEVEAGIELVRRAVSELPNFPTAFSNLGRLLADRGLLADAVAAYQRVTELCPAQSDGWYNLGVARNMNGDSAGALAALAVCIKLNPAQADAYSELGQIYLSQKRIRDAVDVFSTAVSRRPGSARAHDNLGNALLRSDEFEKAIHQYELAVQLEPQRALFHTNLGIACGRSGRHSQAIAAFDRAIQLDPQYLLACNGKARALSAMDRFDEAVAVHRSALKLKPTDAEAHAAFGVTLSEKGDVAEAERHFRIALSLNPESADSLKGLSLVLGAQGRFEEAVGLLNQLLERDPDDSVAYQRLVEMGRDRSKGEVEKLLRLLASPDLALEDRLNSSFAIGKLYDDGAQYDDAFRWYSQANAIFRQRCAERGERFSADDLRRRVDEHISWFTSDFYQARQNWSVQDSRPVFIVGMPRSGTTLVEQIAGSHSRIFGAGELREIPEMYGELVDATGPDPRRWDKEWIHSAAKTHMKRLERLGGQAVRIIDKLPANIMNLGLIAMLFPRARVIFTHRDPRDNCLSCYFQRFREGNLLFSYDLRDCAAQYLEQQRIAAHWARVLPLQMMTLRYEELVGDLEGQSRRLIKFLGVDWEPACLDFHKTERTVLTASVWQVRQPIYTRSAGRWKNYELHLGSLFEALQMNRRDEKMIAKDAGR